MVSIIDEGVWVSIIGCHAIKVSIVQTISEDRGMVNVQVNLLTDETILNKKY